MIISTDNKNIAIESLSGTTTKSGLEVPERDHDSRPCVGRVIETWGEDSKYEKGDVLFFDRYDCIQIDTKEKTFYSIIEDRVRGKIDLDS